MVAATYDFQSVYELVAQGDIGYAFACRFLLGDESPREEDSVLFVVRLAHVSQRV